MISHDVYNKNSTHGSKLYETTNGGRGVLISLEKENKEETRHTITEKYETPLSMPIDNTTTIQEEKSNDTNEKKKGNDMYEKKNITLAKRFTKVAEYMLKESGSSGGVLTTSPAVDHHQQVAFDDDIQAAKKKNITTIEIECMKCGSDTRAEGGARAFVRGPEPLSIVLCSNRLSSQREVDEVLVHELVHIYDVHSRKMDLRDCKQLAYSEVRAAREAECFNSLTAFTANICAKDKAVTATRNMFPESGRKCVCDIFDEAIKDHAPFEKSIEGKDFNQHHMSSDR